jgi:iron complex outermembrane recepter protein
LKVSGLYQSTRGDGLSEVTKLPCLGDLRQDYIAGVGRPERSVQAYSVVLKAKLGRVDLTSITGYNNNWTLGPLDFTSIFGPVTQAEFGVPGTALIYHQRTEKAAQEVRFSAPINRRFEWMAGAFFTHEHGDFLTTIDAQDR